MFSSKWPRNLTFFSLKLINMKNSIQIFRNEMFGEIRTMTNEKGETFFVGKDVAKALGYSNPSNALQVHVDNEDKTTYLIQVSGSKYMIYYQDGAKMMRPVLTREQYLALRGSEQQKANLKADCEVKGYSRDLTTSCTTNPASMKPKMAVMWGRVPLICAFDEHHS